jgi:predicted small lipoprotein YifL
VRVATTVTRVGHPKENAVPGRGLARLAPLVLVVAASLTGCGGGDPGPADTPSASTEADSVAVTITREDGQFTPNGERVELGVNQALVLTVTADEAGELHVHSTPEQEIAYESGTSEHEITIDRPGVVEVESHDPDSIVLQLEVR